MLVVPRRLRRDEVVQPRGEEPVPGLAHLRSKRGDPVLDHDSARIGTRRRRLLHLANDSEDELHPSSH